MGKILIVIAFIIFFGILWSLPLYVCANLVLWLFHIPFHVTLFQSLGLCLLANVIYETIFKHKEDK